jgi:hypothetical protein
VGAAVRGALAWKTALALSRSAASGASTSSWETGASGLDAGSLASASSGDADAAERYL